MATDNETVADVVREMRRWTTERLKVCEKCREYDFAAEKAECALAAIREDKI